MNSKGKLFKQTQTSRYLAFCQGVFQSTPTALKAMVIITVVFFWVFGFKSFQEINTQCNEIQLVTQVYCSHHLLKLLTWRLFLKDHSKAHENSLCLHCSDCQIMVETVRDWLQIMNKNKSVLVGQHSISKRLKTKQPHSPHYMNSTIKGMFRNITQLLCATPTFEMLY